MHTSSQKLALYRKNLFLEYYFLQHHHIQKSVNKPFNPKHPITYLSVQKLFYLADNQLNSNATSRHQSQLPSALAYHCRRRKSDEGKKKARSTAGFCFLRISDLTIMVGKEVITFNITCAQALCAPRSSISFLEGTPDKTQVYVYAAPIIHR